MHYLRVRLMQGGPSADSRSYNVSSQRSNTAIPATRMTLFFRTVGRRKSLLCLQIVRCQPCQSQRKKKQLNFPLDFFSLTVFVVLFKKDIIGIPLVHNLRASYRPTLSPSLFSRDNLCTRTQCRVNDYFYFLRQNARAGSTRLYQKTHR